MKIEKIKIASLLFNTGQIEGLSKNPRIIRDEKYSSLLESLKADPEMMDLNELWVVPFEDKYVVIAGNMRLKGCRELKWKEIPCKIIPAKTTAAKLRSYAIKHNVSFGEWEWNELGQEWSNEELNSFGLDAWKPEEDIDYSILDDDAEADETLESMSTGVKKAIQIEFESDHYEEAKSLVKFFREMDAYIGALFIEKLRAEKKLIEKKAKTKA